MLATPVILVVSFAYLGLLFAIAYYGDRRAAAGRSVIASSYVYALSLAVDEPATERWRRNGGAIRLHGEQESERAQTSLRAIMRRWDSAEL